METPALLQAMRADSIPAGEKGMWAIRKYQVDEPGYEEGEKGCISPGNYTGLHRQVMATMHQEFGLNVMADYPEELARHLPCVERAYGRVLVTGLGLGCVLRGLLAQGQIEHITVVERDKSVLDLVTPHLAGSRLTIEHAEAKAWVEATTETFDFAWHDLWSDPDKAEPHLDVLHTCLIIDLRNRIRWQGAWKLDYRLATRLAEVGVGIYAEELTWSQAHK